MEYNNPETYLIKYNVCKQSISNIENEIYSNETKKLLLENELKDLEQVHELLTKLKQFKMDSKKEFILKTINTALKDIFNEDIRIDIEAMSNLENGKINMKYDIILFQNDIEIARNEKLIESNGGGVLSIISILFKMLVGFIYSENKFYMFDESLSQVSADYRPRLSKFLQEFCHVHGFTIILVSHTEELDIHADLVYSLSGSFDKENVPVLNIQEKIGTYPENNYIYAKIKNFQSIVDLEFRFKGFTIIRGSNNIGKSATLRAINSVIFNDFDKNMQRITNARSIETIIEFGFYHKNEEGVLDESKKIKISYKSQKVNYEFDGMTFAGKNLAFDKVQEKIESIGFRYINLKDAYKNFKGNLKDQTERLSLTTQHDGLFLVGSKNTDSSKIFDFLFDSYMVALAISKVKIDINNNIAQYNECNIKIADGTLLLQKEKLKETYFSTKYYLSIFYKKTEYETSINILRGKLEFFQGYIFTINHILIMLNAYLKINNIQSRINYLKELNTTKQLEKINNILSYLYGKKLIETNLSNLLHFESLKKYFEKISTMVSHYTNLILYGRWILFINNYTCVLNNKHSLLIKDNNLKIYIEKIQHYLNLLYSKNTLSNYSTLLNRHQVLNNSRIQLQNKIGILNSIIPLGLQILEYKKSILFISQNIKFITDNQNRTQQLVGNLQMVYTQLQNLKVEFNLEKCSCCNGVGYKHIGVK